MPAVQSPRVEAERLGLRVVPGSVRLDGERVGDGLRLLVFGRLVNLLPFGRIGDGILIEPGILLVVLKGFGRFVDGGLLRRVEPFAVLLGGEVRNLIVREPVEAPNVSAS